MIGSLFVIASVITILALWSRLHEARAQLSQAERERDAYKVVLTALRLVERDRGPRE
jgi:hypothetical protein